MVEMLRVVNRVAKSGLNGCGGVVGLCGHMAWTPMATGGHAEEAEVVETRRAVHMRKGDWHRWSTPVDYCTIAHLFLLPEALARRTPTSASSEQQSGFCRPIAEEGKSEGVVFSEKDGSCIP